VTDAALAHNRFRVHLLRGWNWLPMRRCDARRRVLAWRQIFTEGALALVAQFELSGGLTAQSSAQFVSEALQTFRFMPGSREH
jgi:uncharacterized glyoxalase superfamily metalloenzyme YdcJ